MVTTSVMVASQRNGCEAGSASRGEEGDGLAGFMRVLPVTHDRGQQDAITLGSARRKTRGNPRRERRLLRCPRMQRDDGARPSGGAAAMAVCFSIDAGFAMPLAVA